MITAPEGGGNRTNGWEGSRTSLRERTKVERVNAFCRLDSFESRERSSYPARTLENPEGLSLSQHRRFQTAGATRQARCVSGRCPIESEKVGL